MFASFWKKFTGGGANEALPENRKFHRVQVSESALFELELPQGHAVSLNDISFGGLSIAVQELKDKTFSAVLRVLDLSYRCRLSEAHRGEKQVGYVFEEGNESVLVFLQPIMNALHQGASLRSIDSGALKDETKQRYNMVLRGEGPVDILIESTKDATQNCLLTFRKDKVYRQIAWRDGIISTGKLLDDRGVSPRMNADKDPDPASLKQAMLILAGGLEQDELRKPLKSLLTSLQNLYYKQR